MSAPSHNIRWLGSSFTVFLFDLEKSSFVNLLRLHFGATFAN